MKKLYLSVLILLTIFNSLRAQQQAPHVSSDTIRHFPFWSLSVNAGMIVPFSTFGNLYNNSISAGLELSYHPTHRIAFQISSQYNFLSVKDINFNGTAGYLELGIGPRIYFGKRPEVFFVEAEIGDYIYYLSLNNYVNGSSSNTNNYFGIKAGVGGNMPLSPKIYLFVKTDFHMIFSPKNKTYYLGLYGGVRFVL
jgi:hypothetical protein